MFDLNNEEKPTLSVGGRNRSTAAQIVRRRKEMINWDRLGLKPKEWIPRVAAKFNASEEAVKRDWSNRKKWMDMYFQTTEIQTLGLDSLFDYEIAVQEATELFNETKDLKMKPTTLGLKLKAIKMKHERARARKYSLDEAHYLFISVNKSMQKAVGDNGRCYLEVRSSQIQRCYSN
jgi:hypothetical protein